MMDLLNAAIDKREEGVMLKLPSSTYHVNGRKREYGWLKMKVNCLNTVSRIPLKLQPDYAHEVSDDMDLMIVGAYYGTGQRAHLLSHFLLALVDGEQFVTVCKVL